MSSALLSKRGFSVESATLDIEPYKLHRLEVGPNTTTTLSREDALQYFSDMVTVRRMETAAANLYKEKAIRGFCHLCSGQEAICCGIKAGITEKDSVITSYRYIDHVISLLFGPDFLFSRYL